MRNKYLVVWVLARILNAQGNCKSNPVKSKEKKVTCTGGLLVKGKRNTIAKKSGG
jgi:hypothetical protein